MLSAQRENVVHPGNGKMRTIYGFLTGIALFAIPGFGAFLSPKPAFAEMITACTTTDFCYCVNAANRSAIDANIARLRQLILDKKNQGKAIGYMSIPLSTVGGSYFGVNQDVAQFTKDRIEKRLGVNSAWVLNPGAEGNLPQGSSGADYMYMWTEILESRRGFGEDFDFVYFVGPSEYREFFGLRGQSDLDVIDAYFDKRAAQDQHLKDAVDQNKISKQAFRNYYGLRASVAFSFGSHDEWNIARIINERRRGSEEFGIANQLGILFDGQPVSPGNFESSIASGDVGRCIN
jgi:hypothetical protein